MKRGQIPIALYMFAVFLSGMLVGAFGHRVYTVKSVSADLRKPPSEKEFRARYVNELRTRLRLNDPQVQKLEGILEATGKRVREVREKYGPEMKQIHEEQVREIRAMLEPSQTPDYDKFLEERERRRREGRR